MLAQHLHAIPGVLPPLSYLEKYIEKADLRGHWFWRDSRRNHAHSDSGHALLKWRVRPTSKTLFESHGTYTVARLLLEHQNGGLDAAARYKNACGLPQCVAPAHWTSLAAAPLYRLELRNGDAWVLVHAASGVMLLRPAPVRLRCPDNTIHAAVVVPGEPITLMCGAAPDPAQLLVVEATVTCRAGC